MVKRIVPDVVSKQVLRCLVSSAMAIEAAKQMAAHRVSAILVTEESENGRLVGIVTEQDITRRIVAAGLDPKKTALDEIMTPDPECIRSDDAAELALTIMRQRRIRHLPIVDDGKLLGIVSMRDLRIGYANQQQRKRNVLGRWLRNVGTGM